MIRLTENRTLLLCVLIFATGVALRVPQILAGDWPAPTTTENPAMSKHVYRVRTADGRTILNVEAAGKHEARSFALKDVEVERLSAGEAVALTVRGIAIVSAETGTVINASPEAEAN